MLLYGSWEFWVGPINKGWGPKFEIICGVPCGPSRENLDHFLHFFGIFLVPLDERQVLGSSMS